MKEFMLQFNKGQEYLITAEKLRFRYNRQGSGGITIIDMEMTPSMLASCLESKDNRDITTFYNGERLFNINIDTKSNPNLVIIESYDPFPGYEKGHPAYNPEIEALITEPKHIDEMEIKEIRKQLSEQRASIKQGEYDARVKRCRNTNEHALDDALRIYESLVHKGALHARSVLQIAGSFKYPLF